MTGAQIRKARATLGQMWVGRPLRASELGRVLRLEGRDPGASVLAWESGHAGLRAGLDRNRVSCLPARGRSPQLMAALTGSK